MLMLYRSDCVKALQQNKHIQTHNKTTGNFFLKAVIIYNNVKISKLTKKQVFQRLTRKGIMAIINNLLFNGMPGCPLQACLPAKAGTAHSQLTRLHRAFPCLTAPGRQGFHPAAHQLQNIIEQTTGEFVFLIVKVPFNIFISYLFNTFAACKF